MDLSSINTNQFTTMATTKKTTQIKGFKKKFSVSSFMTKIARSESKSQVLGLIKQMKQELKQYCSNSDISKIDMMKATEAAKMVEFNGNRKARHLDKEKQIAMQNKLEEKMDSMDEIKKKREKLLRKKANRKQCETEAIMDVQHIEGSGKDLDNVDMQNQGSELPGGFDVVCDGVASITEESVNIDLTL